MIEFIAGFGAGIYSYKKLAFVRSTIDRHVINIYNTMTDALLFAHNKITEVYYNARYKIVRFDDDTYAVRRGILVYDYCDLGGTFWWPRSSTYFTECKGSLDECKRMLKKKKVKKVKKVKRETKYGVPID